MFLEKVGCVGQFHRILLHGDHPREGANHAVPQPQGSGAAAGAMRIEQIDDFLVPHGRRHRDLRNVQVWKGSADAAGASYDAGDAETDVVGALVADHLRRHARHYGALDGRSAIRVV